MKNNTKSFLITVFFGFVIMGALIINIVPKNWILKINFWGMEALKNVVTTKYLYDAMFKYILRIRIKIYVVCMFFILTRFRKKAIFIFDAFLGFSWGTLLSELLSDYGVNGMRIGFFMLFPHIIFYVLSILCAYIKFTKNRGKTDAATIAVVIISAILEIMGIASESAVYCYIFPYIFR